jgi:hypothetical protein
MKLVWSAWVLLLAMECACAADPTTDTLSMDFEGGESVVEDAATQTGRIDGLPTRRRAADGPLVPSGAARLGPPQVQFESGNSSQRRAHVIVDPDRPGNHVLEFEVREANVQLPAGRGGAKARVQMNVYGNRGVREVYQSVRVRLGDGFEALVDAPERFDWLTLSEWWNDAGWTGEALPFRVSVNLSNRGNGGERGLYLYAKATAKVDGGKAWSAPVWAQRMTGPALPLGQWLRLETYIREGRADTGRFVMFVTLGDGARRLAIDVTGATHHPGQTAPDGIAQFNPVKLYTSRAVVEAVRRRGARLSVLWDDLTILACGRAPDGEPSACAKAAKLK